VRRNSHVLWRELFCWRRGDHRIHLGHRASHRHHDPGIFERIDRSVREFPDAASAGSSNRVRGVSGAAIRIFYCFVLRLVDVFERVVQRLGLANVCVGELLGNGADFGKVLQLECDVRGDPVSD